MLYDEIKNRDVSERADGLGFYQVFPSPKGKVDCSGMIEFQEFKVFWEKLKKWMVRIQNVSLTSRRKQIFL